MIQGTVHRGFRLRAKGPNGGGDERKMRRRDGEIKASTSVVRMWLVRLMFAATAQQSELALRDETSTNSTLKPPSAAVQTPKCRHEPA